MEAAAVLAHGSSAVFEDRLYAGSDGKCSVAPKVTEATPGHMYVCTACNLRADTHRRPGGWCFNCDSSRSVVSVETCAVFDTLIGEIATLSIGTKMEVEKI